MITFNNNHLTRGPPRFLPTRSSSRRGLPPPLRGGNSSSKESPALPIPSYPALCREDTTSWNHGRPSTDNKRKCMVPAPELPGANSLWLSINSGRGKQDHTRKAHSLSVTHPPWIPTTSRRSVSMENGPTQKLSNSLLDLIVVFHFSRPGWPGPDFPWKIIPPKNEAKVYLI